MLSLHLAAQRLAPQVTLDFINDHPAQTPTFLPLAAGQVRSQNHVGKRQQRRPGVGRFGFGHIQQGPKMPSSSGSCSTPARAVLMKVAPGRMAVKCLARSRPVVAASKGRWQLTT